MTKKSRKTGLGKGLSALLGETEEPISTHADQVSMQVATNKLRPGEYQPRLHFNEKKMDDLRASIQQRGIIQPLVVRSIGEGSYEIVAGERRWRAACDLKLDTVPVVIKAYENIEAFETALIENIERDDLNPIEEARAYQRFVDEFNLTQEEIGRRFNKSRSYIANMLRLNRLPEEVQDLIIHHKISAGHARAIASAKDQKRLLSDIVSNNLSVRDAEKAAKSTGDNSSMRLDNTGESQEAALALAQQLSDNIGFPVSIKIKKSGGEISIKFTSFEEMDDIIERFKETTQRAESVDYTHPTLI